MAIKTSIPNKSIKLEIADENLAVWFYNLKTNGNDLTIQKIPFSDFKRDVKFEHVPKINMGLKRVKGLIFNLSCDSKKEIGHVEIRKIRVY